MLLFLVSEAFLFGSLFWTYFYLRAKSPLWPPEGVHLEVGLMSVNTLLLLASSVTLERALASLRSGRGEEFFRGLSATILLGGAFLLLKTVDWVGAPFRPWDHAYGSIYFTLTGFHALHLLIGIGILGVLLLRARRGLLSPENRLPLEVGSLYWHFVDLVWVFVFLSLFVVQ
jgi:heme/copper-type cytochrome/quinol oxidase subunit 3